MIDDINTKRTELANQMAAAGAANLDFTGTAAVLAAIPDTEPQQYVAAGTPENIAAILPATISPARRMRHGDRPTEALVFDEPAATSGDAPTDLQQLKALALAATPGKWKMERLTNGGYHNVGIRVSGPLVSGYVAVINTRWEFKAQQEEQEANAAFIAAANPAVVLGLIARIESQSDLLTESRAVFDLMLDGCRDSNFGDFQNGHGDTIGPRMDALHAKLRGARIERTTPTHSSEAGDAQ